MRLSDLLRCAKPLLFEDGPEGFEYSAGGTFFLVRHADRFYGITAKHALRNRNREAIRLTFDELSSEEDRFLPLKAVHEITDPPSGAANWSDLAVMELEPRLMTDDQRRSEWFLDFDLMIARDLDLCNNELLATRGFPNELGEIDYDRRKITTKAFGVDGKYGGKAACAHTHVFRFSDLSQINDPNGLSGSPVFLLRRLPGGLDYQFAGVILLASKASELAHFVDCWVVFQTLLYLKNQQSR